LRRAGFGPVVWQRAEYRRAVPDVAGYRSEFAALAPTSYAAYRRATEAERRQVRTLLARLLDQSRRRSEGAELTLTWWLGVGRRGGVPAAVCGPYAAGT